MKTKLTSPTSILHSAQIRSSPLCVPVFNVIGLASEKQVIGINTSGDVALMANARPMPAVTLRNGAVVKLPTNPMGLRVSSVDSYPSIAKPIGATNPNPTAFSFDYFRPEPLRYIHVDGVSLRGVN